MFRSKSYSDDDCGPVVQYLVFDGTFAWHTVTS